MLGYFTADSFSCQPAYQRFQFFTAEQETRSLLQVGAADHRRKIQFPRQSAPQLRRSRPAVQAEPVKIRVRDSFFRAFVFARTGVFQRPNQFFGAHALNTEQTFL